MCAVKLFGRVCPQHNAGAICAIPNRMTDDKLITLASRVRNCLSYYSDNHRMQTHNGVNMFGVKRKRFVRLYGPGHLPDEQFW